MLLPAGHAQVQGDGQHRREDRQDPAHPVDAGGSGNAQLNCRPVADSRADSAADNGPQNRNVRRPRMKKRAITPIIAPVMMVPIRASIVVSKGCAPAAVTGGWCL